MSKFEIFRAVNGQYYFRLKAENGQIVANSEGYTSKQNALAGIAAVKRCAPTANIVDLT
jgi:uncharacterized protein YegP (UPF0339 family)